MSGRGASRAGRIGVLVNPWSRKHRSGPELADALGRQLGARGEVVTAGTPEDLHDAARRFRDREIEILAVSGGDGSTGFALTALETVYGDAPLPRVALLRGGTMNTIANGIGVPRRSPERLLARLLAALDAGRALPVSPHLAMRVRHEDGTTRLGFLFGMGLGYGFLEEYYAWGQPHPTPLTAAQTLARIAGSILVRGRTARRVVAPIDVSVRADGAPFTARRYITLLAGTVEQVGLGFRPFYRTGEARDRFHLVGVHGSPASVVARLHRVRLGRTLGPGLAEEALAGEALFDCPGGEVPYFLDGDLYRARGALRLEAGPLVSFVTPS